MSKSNLDKDSFGKVLPVVGAFFGDEGKAKIVDYLSHKFDYVVRYQGGDNAGHSVFVNGEKYVFQTIPCGILQSKALISHGVVLNPESLILEASRLCGVLPIEERLFVANNAQIICDWHIAYDKLIEIVRGDSCIGTTGRGIGPAYSSKSLRLGLRAIDLLDRESLRSKIKLNLDVLNPLFEKYKMSLFNVEECTEKYFNLGQKIKPYLVNFFSFLNEELSKGKSFLFEGSQGLLLDLDLGTYPFVTSSNVFGSLISGTGLSPKYFCRVLGVVKAYSTRVGNGEFVTEIFGDEADFIRKKGNEFGSVTGRPRRIGWLDLVAVKYSFTFSGVSEMALTLVDVLNGMDEIKVCVGYSDEFGNSVEFSDANLSKVKPIFRSFKA